ncbi:MAG TPA: Hsp20/alpha crystallin family protein [Planctomycetota bacterium]|nr:Hsp20/alpha crystallin family protein [Planctomycetota bacterium]
MKTGNRLAPATHREDAAPSLFNDFFGGFFGSPFQGQTPGSMHPALDVVENAEGYTMTVDLPGFTQDQVNVHFAQNTLTVQGERVEETQRDDARWHVVERSRGTFARSVRFPTAVDASRVKAVMKNGVLNVYVPKAETARTQKIKVDAGE